MKLSKSQFIDEVSEFFETFGAHQFAIDTDNNNSRRVTRYICVKKNGYIFPKTVDFFKCGKWRTEINIDGCYCNVNDSEIEMDALYKLSRLKVGYSDLRSHSDELKDLCRLLYSQKSVDWLNQDAYYQYSVALKMTRCE